MIAVKDLQGLEFIAFEKDIPTRKATDEILAKSGIDVSGVMEFDNVKLSPRLNNGACDPSSQYGRQRS